MDGDVQQTEQRREGESDENRGRSEQYPQQQRDRRDRLSAKDSRIQRHRQDRGYPRVRH